jgi:hypothetical protein
LAAAQVPGGGNSLAIVAIFLLLACAGLVLRRS